MINYLQKNSGWSHQAPFFFPAFIKHVLCLWFLLCHLLSFAQSSGLADPLEEAKNLTFSDPPRAMELANEALEIARQQQNQRRQTAALQVLTRLYAEQGRYADAVESALSALRVYQNLEDHKEVCRMYIYLGVVYRYWNQYDQSLEYYRQAEAIAQTYQLDTLKASIWGNMGNVFYDQHNYEAALQHHQRSLEIDRIIRDTQGIGNSLHNIGMVYRSQGKYELAIQHYEQSLAIDEALGNLRNISTSYLDFTELYLDLGDYSKAREYGEKALDIAQSISSLRQQEKVLLYLTLAYAGLGDQQASKNYFEQHRLITDSLQSITLAEKIAEMETRFKTEEQDKALALQQRSIGQQRWLIAGLLLILLLASLTAFLLFNRYKLKQQTRRLQLELETEHIRQLEQLKSQFFANISHEFRTPLNLILAPLQKDDPVIAPQEVHMMRRNAQRLLRLVNQLLDLARIEVGLMALEQRPLEVFGFINNLAQSFVPLAESRSIRYQMDIPERDAVVLADPDKIEKIVYNLLSNAFKFTPKEGQVSIHLTKEGPNQLRLSVSDTGIGISDELKPKIFDRFYQIDPSQTRKYEGTGIGLSLTKELIDLQGGNILVDSQTGKGSTFTVYLPLKEADQQTVEPSMLFPQPSSDVQPDYAGINPELATIPKIADENRPQLLIVEDNTDLRTYLQDQLHSEYVVWAAENGQAGLDLAQERIPDLIITDIMMPEMDGITLTQELRKSTRTSHIPIVLLTARDDGETKIQGFETGAEQYLVKPFALDELKARLHSLLLQRKRLQEKFSREVTLQPSEVTLPDRDAAFLKQAVQVVEDNLENPNFSVEQLQRALGLSRMHLHRKLKALVDQSAGEFIRSIKLKRAAQLLQQPGIPVTEVAYQSGFNHLSYFAKCFKEQFGVSPSEYARQTES